MEMHVKALLELTHVLDYVMPGIKNLFNSWTESNTETNSAILLSVFGIRPDNGDELRRVC
jgi:hypothetical protein